jgi:hypothetical protein
VQSPSDHPPDRQLTAEELVIAGALSPDMVRRIDAVLLAQARVDARKVAMLVGIAMDDPAIHVDGLPDVYFAGRVKAMVEKGLLIASGNLASMRYSEVRLPQSP